MIESHVNEGRTKVSLAKKLNPLWWFMNDVEQTVEQAPWYIPEKPLWWRYVMWTFVRNPLMNLHCFGFGWSWLLVVAVVVALHFLVGASWWWLLLLPVFTGGVQDRNYVVTGRAPVMTVQRNDLNPPETGIQWCVSWLPLPLPFVSYCGKKTVAYLGWQPSGVFNGKLVPA